MKQIKLFYYISFYFFVQLLVSNSWAQTTLISPSGDGGFENGSTFEANGWTVSNSSNNPWIVRPLSNGLITGNAAFISSNGTSPSYGTTSISSNYFWRDVTVPAGESGLSLSFNWIANGESTWDLWQVFVAPTTVTPVGGVSYPGSGTTLTPTIISGATWLANGNLQTTAQTANVVLPTSLIGTTFRLIFYWKNDGDGGSQPPAQIDNIKLISFSAMAGIYSIDNSIAESATNFNSFSSAIEALNMRGISGSVTFNVTAGQTFNENLPALTATGTASNTITFQKSGAGNNPKIVPTGIGTTDFGICISGGDYITFDGIDVDGSAASTTTNAIEFGYLIRNASATNGAQNNTIKNCSVTLNKNYISTTANACIFSSVSSTQGGVTPTNATGANSYNKYYNLTLNNAQNGIYAVGNSTYPDLSSEFGVEGTSCQTYRSTISNIGGVYSGVAYGIYAQYQNSAKIFNFDISNIRAKSNISSGVYFLNFTGTNEIFQNSISDVSNSGTTSGTSLAAGIQIQNSSGTATARVYNNFIYDIKSSYTSSASSTIMAYGIYCNVSTSSTTSEIDNNNVYLSVVSGTPTYSAACFGIGSTTGIHKVRGNIFVNVFPNQTSSAYHTAFYSPVTNSIGGTGSISNFNDLYVIGTNGYVGRGSSTNYATLANWQVRTGTPDANSISIDPTFTNSTDLHVSAAGLTGISGFTPQIWVTRDFDCDPQGPTYRIGADAPAGSACVTPTDQATNLQLTTVTSNSLQASFTVAASSPSGYLVVRSTSNTLSSYPVNATSYAIGNALGGGFVVQSSIGTSFSESSLTDNTTYYYFVFSYNNSGCSGGPLYNLTNPLTASITTCLATPLNPTFSDITSSEMTVNWNAINGANNYNLEVATDGAFTLLINGSPFIVSETSKVITGLTSGNTYYVRITAVGGNCNSAVSPSANTTLTCAAPSNQATSLLFSNSTTSSISGSFTPATSTPSGYLVVRSTSSTLSANPVDGTSYSSGNSLGGGTVVQAGTTTTINQSSLSSNTTYYYYIFSFNNTNCSGGPVYNTTNPLNGSVTTCLSGTPSTPTLSNETTSSIQATWTAFTGATSYRLDVSTNSSFSSYVTDYQDFLVSGTSQTITGLNSNTLYYVRVRAHNESCPSSNSNYVSRTTLKIEPSNQPTNFAASSASTSSIPLIWTSAIAGSQLPEGYLIKASDTSLEAIEDPVDGVDPDNVTTFTSSSANKKQTTGTSISTTSFSGMIPGTMYYYKIFSYTNSSIGIDFKTDNSPTLYHATQPNNSGTPVFTATPLNASQATITWAQPSGYDSTKHKILVFVKSGSTAISTTALTLNPTNYSANTFFGSGNSHPNDASAYCVYNGDGTSVSISGLTGNTTYQVRVLVGMLDANSNSTYTYSSGVATSGTTYKTEPINQPTNFATTSVSSSSISLNWSAAVAGSQTPDGYLIKGSTTSFEEIVEPVDGIDLANSTSFSSGSANVKTTGSFYSSFTNQTPGTMYYYKIYSFTNATTSSTNSTIIDYKLDNVPTLYHATQPNNSGTPTFISTPLNSSQATISWSLPIGFDANKHKVLVFVKSGSTAITTTSLTANPTSFNANTIFSSGTSHSSDAFAYCVYNGDGSSVTISGLTGNTTYQVRILVGMLDANSNSTYTYSSGVTTSGTTFKIEPSNQPTNFAAGIATTSNIPLSWTAAIAGSQAPDGYLIKGSATSLDAISDPVDGVDSSSDTSFSDGSVMVKPTSNSYSSFSNHTVGTMYYYKIYSFTNTTTFSTSPNVDYKTDNVPTLYHATLPAANTTLEFSNTTSNTTTITWIQPATYSNANHSTLVFIKAGSAVTVGTPTSSPSSYSANATFALGTTYQNDISAYCIYKGDLTNVTVHGLDGNTNYHVLIVTVVDATNSNGKNSYSTTLTSNKTTLCNAVDTFNLDFEGTTSLPQCTSFLSSDNLGANINNEPYGGLKSLGLQNSTTFILPFVTNAHLNTHYINFYARTLLNVTGQIGFGYLTNPSDATTYVNLKTFDLNSTYKLCTYTPTNIPENAYIAIKLLTSSVLRIDNIVWEAVPLSQISSSLTASGTVGSNFQYDIIASNNPTSYAASGLPAGLSIDTTTGVISGTPTESGVFLVVISATNGGGTTTETLEITVVPTTTLHSRSCGATISAATSFIYADNVPHADAYEFKVTYDGIDYPIVISSDHRFRLSEVSGLPLLFNATYSIRVRVVINGVVSDFGSSCNVMTPSIPTTTLGVQSCGATLSATTSFIYAASVVGASAYEFEVTHNNITYPTVVSNDYRFRLSEVEGLPLLFGATYSIKVRIHSNGFEGAFGSSCNVMTPSIPTTTLGVQSCGATLSATTSFIYAASVVGASAYEFEVTHNNITYPTVVSNDYRFRLSEVEGLPLLFGATYSIKVRIHSNGFEGAFSSFCNVMTPSIPTITLGVQSCGTILSVNTSFIYAASVVGASAYEFEVTYNNITYPTVVSNDYRFRLSEVTGLPLVASGDYNIRVRVHSNNQEGSYGQSCLVTVKDETSTTRYVTTKEALHENVKVISAYPNPFTTTFSITPIEGETATLFYQVYDVTGKMIESRSVEVSEITNHAIGEYYPVGMYLVMVRQGATTQTLKMVKQ